jgi:hypothetical protein
MLKIVVFSFLLSPLLVRAQDFFQEDLIGTWHACGDVDWDEVADTLFFQKSTPPCRDFDCGRHDWSFLETGLVEFIFTKGCESGFHSKSKIPKRWIYQSNVNRILLITNNGDKEYFDIQRLDEKLSLIHRKDLED